MSVSTLDKPLSTSNTGMALPNTSRSDTAPSIRQNSANVSFAAQEQPAGPSFDQFTPLSTSARLAGNSQAGTQQTLPQMFMKMFEKFFAAWFSPQRPPVPEPCPCKPGKPDPQYGTKNNEELAQLLLDNFDAFKDPKSPSYITKQGLEAMASRPLTGDPDKDRNIHLAKELLKRPDLVDALDRHSTTGALDGLIDRQKIEMTIKGQSPFKYQSDKQLAAEMLKHFDELKGGFWSRTINIDDLKDLAGQKLTGDASKDNLIWLAREIIQRSEALKKMDNTRGLDDDGLISKKGLKKLSR
ncbi:MAG: hypothetical protein GAK37_01184 [Pseudomonas sp.]|nr:MAG: hypothetical protein GAK37_01184 [Pseudomonas sp.]